MEGDVVLEAGGTAEGDESGDCAVLAIYSVINLMMSMRIDITYLNAGSFDKIHLILMQKPNQ